MPQGKPEGKARKAREEEEVRDFMGKVEDEARTALNVARQRGRES